MEDKQENIQMLARNVKPDVVLAQCAEEACELGQAALKLIRACGYSENPTVSTIQECFTALAEEAADVMVCLDVLIEMGLIDKTTVDDTIRVKAGRWVMRTNE